MTAAPPSSSLLSSSTHNCVIVSPIMLDELDKTDKIQKIAKIRKRICRSVSFIKKALVRNNSNLSQISSFDGVSNHSIISLDETIEMNDDTSEEPFIDSLKALRSCLKGNRQNSSKHKFVVRFQQRSKYNIYKIESYTEYATDLWYTSNEKASLLSPQIETVTETMRAEQYIVAYSCARKEVYPKEWFEMKERTTMSSSKLLAESYHDIVQGRKYGFAGLEQYSASLKKRRKIHIQSVVFMTCAAYYDCKKNSINIKHSNTNIQAKLNPDGTLSYNTTAELVRKYSKSLTECDRYWATAMGQADCDAALEIYHNDDCTGNKITRIVTSQNL